MNIFIFTEIIYNFNQKEELFENIKTAPIKIPKSMSQEAKDLIKQVNKILR